MGLKVKIAELVGISVRTLHPMTRSGCLLRKRTDFGYRLYTDSVLRHSADSVFRSSVFH